MEPERLRLRAVELPQLSRGLEPECDNRAEVVARRIDLGAERKGSEHEFANLSGPPPARVTTLADVHRRRGPVCGGGQGRLERFDRAALSAHHRTGGKDRGVS